MESLIQKALKMLLDKFGVEYDVITISEEYGRYRANIETPDAPRLIGRGGTTLSALEYLLKMIIWQKNTEKVFVTLDVDGYRKVKEEALLEKVRGKIEDMRENNLSETILWPMKPALRRIVHLWIAGEFKDLTTDSDGEGRDRAIKVMYK